MFYVLLLFSSEAVECPSLHTLVKLLGEPHPKYLLKKQTMAQISLFAFKLLNVDISVGQKLAQSLLKLKLLLVLLLKLQKLQ